MKFSTRSSYGLRAMAKLAANYGQGPYSLHKLAKEEKISLPYLERLMAKLKRSGLVNSTKGLKGGYELSRAPLEVKVGEIFEVLEGSLAPFFCVSEKGKKICQGRHCAGKMVWQRLQVDIAKSLNSFTLSDLIK
ncbi:MAG: Rrf2 family transcriptional regulator [bacterium]